MGRATALAATVTASACSRNKRICSLTFAVFRAAVRTLSDILRSDASLFRTSGGMMKQVHDMATLLVRGIGGGNGQLSTKLPEELDSGVRRNDEQRNISLASSQRHS